MLVAGKSAAAAAAWVLAPEVERAWVQSVWAGQVWAPVGRVWPLAAKQAWEAGVTLALAQAPLPSGWAPRPAALAHQSLGRCPGLLPRYRLDPPAEKRLPPSAGRAR
jgi:hypothetical protein